MAGEFVKAWMADNPGKVAFANFASLKLWLQDPSKPSGACEHNNTGCVGIQPMGRPRFLWRINLLENGLQGVAPVTAAGMHRQRSRLIDHNQGCVFMKNLDVHAHVWFNLV